MDKQTTLDIKELIKQDSEGWAVILWNDDYTPMDIVVAVLVKVMGFSVTDSKKYMLEAHQNGKVVLIIIHRERAELYQEQLSQYGLTVTISQI